MPSRLVKLLPGDDYAGPNGGGSFIKIDPMKAADFVDWFIRGDRNGALRLTPVIVDNESSKKREGDPGKAERRDELAEQLPEPPGAR